MWRRFNLSTIDWWILGIIVITFGAAIHQPISTLLIVALIALLVWVFRRRKKQ